MGIPQIWHTWQSLHSRPYSVGMGAVKTMRGGLPGSQSSSMQSMAFSYTMTTDEAVTI